MGMRFAPIVCPFRGRLRICNGETTFASIRGKVFAPLALRAVPQKVCFKCVTETFDGLLEREHIRPAPYVGRYKWVILDRLDALGRSQLQDWIQQSYAMVAAKAPGKSKPQTAKKKPAASQGSKRQR
ncbi:MAG TPA: MmcQ/YjbR family DNA-binding protein [Candidatus Sulfotelmatobacter sp.]|jgi:predicted DNA-binding protein (MmcQ/YjbR family)